MLNQGKSAQEIYKTLFSVKRFREFLPAEAPKAVFAIPLKKPIEEKHETDSMLGKRLQRQKSSRG